MGYRHSVVLLTLLWAQPLQAENLRQIYDLSVYRDPTVQAAYALLQANKQALPEALAQMGPNLSANYQATANNSSPGTPNIFVASGNYNTKAYSLNLSQPIYHPEFWAQLEQARHVVKGATATYLSATQSLIIRVAKQYFAILGAMDDLDYTKGKSKAFAREYEQAKQRFEVGLIAITDVETAKAQYDLAHAEEISAQNALADQYEKLREITGQPISQVTVFDREKKLPLLPPTPQNQESWVNTAHKQNWDVIAARENANQLKAAIGVQTAGHFPKVDVTGSLQRQKYAPPFVDTNYTRTAVLNISIPIFASGSVLFQTKEAQSRYEEAMKQLEAQQRLTDSNTRQAYRGVLTSINQVNALAQAVTSNQSSLKSTQASYEVGTRTMVEVLDAESKLLGAERDFAKARYSYLLQGLLLKQAAGTLTPDDLYSVNDLIVSRR